MTSRINKNVCMYVCMYMNKIFLRHIIVAQPKLRSKRTEWPAFKLVYTHYILYVFPTLLRFPGSLKNYHCSRYHPKSKRRHQLTRRRDYRQTLICNGAKIRSFTDWAEKRQISRTSHFCVVVCLYNYKYRYKTVHRQMHFLYTKITWKHTSLLYPSILYFRDHGTFKCSFQCHQSLSYNNVRRLDREICLSWSARKKSSIFLIAPT